MKNIAIIPARGGSKRLKNKNIFLLKGKPLIAYTIEALKKSRYIDEVFVSSDSQDIIDVSKTYDAIGIYRDKYADDETPKIIAIRYALKQIEELYPDNKIENIIIAQANSPQINTEMIDKAYQFFIENNLWEVMSADSNGIQNAAFRIVQKKALFNNFLSAHCGFFIADCIDVHTIEDIKKLEKIL